jgi:hypothetical protein
MSKRRLRSFALARAGSCSVSLHSSAKVQSPEGLIDKILPEITVRSEPAGKRPVGFIRHSAVRAVSRAFHRQQRKAFVQMNTIGIAISGYLMSDQRNQGHSPNGTILEDLFVFPEYAIYVMLGVRILLLILGDPRKWNPFALKSSSCSWDGFKRVCTCS